MSAFSIGTSYQNGSANGWCFGGGFIYKDSGEENGTAKRGKKEGTSFWEFPEGFTKLI